MLAGCDYVVMALPLTGSTVGVVGAQELQAMKDSAVLINLGRGSSLVESALVQALREGWIRGAALDVFETEPLPASSPLWQLENLFLSPHCADHTQTWQEDSMRVFLDNFRRWDRGEPLHNLVDKEAGY
jgi:phosphoglycerate dehydrogenase-like enzyme